MGHAITASADPSPARLVLVALNPDGTPARDAVAVASVRDELPDGTSSRPVYLSYATPGGTLAVDIPMSDPYIAAHYPARRLYNVRVDIFTFGAAGRAHPTAYQAVDYILNLGDGSFPTDFAAVNGRVVDLAAVPTLPFAPLAPDLGPPPAEVCAPDRGYPAYGCTTVTHPDDLRNEPVVVAHNIGAGIDMSTRLRIDNTTATSTSIVSGVDGLFVEARGATQLDTANTIRIGFASEGVSSPDEDAVVLVDFERVDTQECWGGDCTFTTTFPPYQVEGSGSALDPTDEPIYHDYAQSPGPTDTDCTVGIQSVWENSNGVNRQESWTFGGDFGGQYQVFTLHANAIVTEGSSTEHSNSYSWSVDAKTKSNHHLFVHAGNLDTADAGAACPENSPGSTYTDASNEDKTNPSHEVRIPADLPPQFDPVTEPVDDAARRAERCYEAPERCGRE
jgi:hypothetical protein